MLKYLRLFICLHYVVVAVTEMIEIMQENGEVVCCLGSSINIWNSSIFSQADVRYNLLFASITSFLHLLFISSLPCITNLFLQRKRLSILAVICFSFSVFTDAVHRLHSCFPLSFRFLSINNHYDKFIFQFCNRPFASTNLCQEQAI